MLARIKLFIISLFKEILCFVYFKYKKGLHLSTPIDIYSCNDFHEVSPNPAGEA